MTELEMLAAGINRGAMRWAARVNDALSSELLVCRLADTMGELAGSDLRVIATLRHLSDASGLAPRELAHALGILRGTGFLSQVGMLSYQEDAPNGWRLVG